jgi:hypothetical protein
MESETIYNTKNEIIPLCEISHLIKEHHGVWVIFKHSKINTESTYKNKYEPSVWIPLPDSSKFIKSYCYFRHEQDECNLKREIK